MAGRSLEKVKVIVVAAAAVLVAVTVCKTQTVSATQTSAAAITSTSSSLEYPFTDLGPVGNSDVARRFAEYKFSHAGCSQGYTGLPRVMISGFGLFSGASYNISGAVIDQLSHGDGFSQGAQGILSENDFGARVVTRILDLPSGPVQACLLLLDVQWDLAGAVLAYEMERFQPSLVLMSGRGSFVAIVESGALNRATSMIGYNPDGTPNHDNLPVAPPVLPGESETAVLTWDQAAVAERIRPLIEATGHRLLVPTGPRGTNDYICNNVSYLIAKAAEGRPLTLAGGELVLTPLLKRAPQVGFFHYPADVQFNADSMGVWSSIFLNAVDAAVPRRGW